MGTKQNRSWTHLLAALLLAGGAVATTACGGDSDSDPTPDPDVIDVDDVDDDVQPDADTDEPEPDTDTDEPEPDTDTDEPEPDTIEPPPSVEADIGAEGGSIELELPGDEGSISVEIPAGALAENTTITVTGSTPEQEDELADEYELSSPIFTFEPAGLVFEQPITVRLPFRGESTSKAIFWSTLDDPSIFAPISTSFDGNVAVGQVTHFSRAFVGRNIAGTCADVTCDDAPEAPFCDGDILTTPGAPTCADGQCVAPESTTDCSELGLGAGTCEDGRCVLLTCSGEAAIETGTYFLSIKTPFDTGSVLFELAIAEGEEDTFDFTLTPLKSEEDVFGGERPGAREPLTNAEGEPFEPVVLTGVTFDENGFDVTFEDVPFSGEGSGTIVVGRDTSATISMAGSTCAPDTFCGTASIAFDFPAATVPTASFAAIRFEDGEIGDAPVLRSCDVLRGFLNDPTADLPEPTVDAAFDDIDRDLFSGNCAAAPTDLDNITATFFATVQTPIVDAPMLVQIEVEPDGDGTYTATANPLRLDIRNYGDPIEWNIRRTIPETFQVAVEDVVEAGQIVEPFIATEVSVDADGRFVILFEDIIIHRDTNPLARYEATGSIELTGIFCGADAEFACGGVTGGALTFPLAIDFRPIPVTFGALTFTDILDAPLLDSCAAVDQFGL